MVAGAPPDALSSVGQLWGNPLYDWRELQAQGYRWWVERLRRTFELYDLARIDHFRGFVSYWSVPEGNRTAKRGRWRRGPGAELFRAAERELGRLPLVAEDLGLITPAVHRLRDELGIPGMVVMQFGFGGHGRTSIGSRTTPGVRSSTPARTTATPRSAGGARSPAARAPRRACRARSRTGS